MEFNSKTIQSIVSNKMSQPFYKFDGINDQILVSNDANMSIGNCNFSYLVSFRTPSNAIAFNGLGFSFYRNGGTTNKEFFRCSSTQIEWYLQDGTGNASYVTANFALAVDTRYTIVAVGDRADTNHLYVNGRKITISGSSSVSRTHTVSQSVDLYIGNYASQNFADGELYAYQRWNKALLQAEARALSAGGAVPFKYKGANQTNNITHTGFVGANASTPGLGWTPGVEADYSSASSGGHDNMPYLTITRASSTSQYAYTYPNQTSGGANIGTTLIEGKMYRASAWVKSGTAGNVSASLNVYNSGWGTHTEGQPAAITSSSDWQEISLEFVATGGGTDGIFLMRSHIASGTGTQLWSDPKIVPVGCTAEYDGSGISSDKWFDKSGNDLHGTVTGATVENAPSGGTPSAIYEEGSWTPTLEDPDGDEPSYFTNSGSYTRVGRLVTFQGNFYINSTSGMSGTIEIHGLPYTSVNQTAVTFGELRQTDRGGSGNLTFLASIVANTAKISMVINNGDGRANSNALQHSAIGYATQWFFGASYEI